MAVHRLRNAMQAVNPLRADERIARWLACQCRLPVDEAAELRLSLKREGKRRGVMAWIATRGEHGLWEGQEEEEEKQPTSSEPASKEAEMEFIVGGSATSVTVICDA